MAEKSKFFHTPKLDPQSLMWAHLKVSPYLPITKDWFFGPGTIVSSQVLREIFKFIPVKELFKTMTVSKQWKKLIDTVNTCITCITCITYITSDLLRDSEVSQTS